MNRAEKRWLDQHSERLFRAAGRFRRSKRGAIPGPIPSLNPLVAQDRAGITTGGDMASGTGPVHWGSSGVKLEPGIDLMFSGNTATAHTYTMTPRGGSTGTLPTRFVPAGVGTVFKGSQYALVKIDSVDSGVLVEVGPEGVFGSASFFRITTAATTNVTVGLPGSGANFTSADGNTAFNAAMAYLATLTPVGGNVTVLPGTYPSTGEWLVSTTSVTIYWSDGAVIKPSVGASYLSPTSNGGGAVWLLLFVIGASDCTIYGGPVCDGSSLVSTNSVGLMVAGSTANGTTKRTRIYGTKVTSCLWGRWVNGFAQPTVGGTFDGLIESVLFVGAKSISCGNTVAPPNNDGGGMKCSPQSTQTSSSYPFAIQTVIDDSPQDVGVKDFGHDFTTGVNVGHTMDALQVIGGFCGSTPGSIPAGSAGVFLEQGISGMTTNVKVTGHEVQGFATGYNLGAQNDVLVTACTANGCTTGFSTNMAIAANATAYRHKYFGSVALGCVTGFSFTTSAGNTGSSLWDMSMTDCTADDNGTGLTTSCLTITCQVTKPIVNLRIQDCDFSRFASGGVAVTFGTSRGPALPGCWITNTAGINDQGLVGTNGVFTTAYGTTQRFETRNMGRLAKPADGSTNTYVIRTPRTTIASSVGTGLSMTALSHWGNPLADMNTGNANALPVASTDYVLRSAESSLTVGTGTAVGLSINVFDPQGRVLAKNAATLTALAIPAFSIINFGAFTVGTPTITAVTMGGTPFGSALTAVATFTTTAFDYNSTLQFVSNTTSGTIVYVSNGVTLANPFMNYFELSLNGEAATATASRVYEAQMVSFQYSGASMVAFALTDQFNNAFTEPSTTAFGGRLPRGWRAFCTTVGTQLPVVDYA